MSKKGLFYKGYCILGCLLLMFSMMFSHVTVSASEVKNMNGILAEDANEYSCFNEEGGIEEVFISNKTENEIMHSVEYDGDYVFEIDLSIVEPDTISALSTDQTKYGIATFKCNTSSGTWLYTAKLQATFHYNGTYAWCTYGYYSFTYNTDMGFGQSVTKNTYSSKKVTSKTKYIVKTSVYSKYGYEGDHKFKLTCTPNGTLNSNVTVTY